jgi:O-antigen/teichoic acid export membrane protein
VDDSTPVPAEPLQQARLRTDVFLTFAGKGSTLLLGLATAAIVARRLGLSGQGTFAVAYSLTLMLVQVGAVGLTTANPYFAARSPAQIPRIIGNALWLSALLGLVLAAVGVAIKVVAPGVIAGLGWTPLLITLAGIPGALAALFLQSVLLGEGRMVAYNSVEVSQAALTLAVLIAGFWLADLRVSGTLAILGGGRYVAAAAYALLLGRRSGIVGRLDTALVREMFAYGFRVYVAILASFLVIRLDH